MNYKTVLGAAGIALSGAVAFSVSAQAADLGGRHETYKDEPVYVAPTTWSGAYIGGHLGAAWTSGNADLDSAYYDVTRYDSKTNTVYYDPNSIGGYKVHKDLGDTSFLGGVHGGVNWQAGAFVYGFEGDVSFGDSFDYLASVRGRLGVAAGNWLFYGTGGVAFVGTNVSGTIADPNGLGMKYDNSDNQTGFVVGGGAEVKLSPNWSIGVEGLYYGFDGTKTKGTDSAIFVDSNGNAAVGFANATAESGADIGVVRGRLSYHFNRGYEPLK